MRPESRTPAHLAAVLLVLMGLPLVVNAADRDGVKLGLLSASAPSDQVRRFIEESPAANFASMPGYRKDSEDKIREACGSSVDATVESFGATLYSLIAKPAIDFLSASISRRLEREGKKYSGGYSASVSGPPYGNLNPDLTFQWSCLRFTRVANGKTTLDFVAQIRLVNSRDALQIRPLRLYYAGKSIEKAENNEVGLAASIKIDSVYMDGVVPKTVSVFEHTLFTSKRTIPYTNSRDLRRQLKTIAKRQGKTSLQVNSIKLFDYMGFVDQTTLVGWEKFTALPLPRWSIDLKKQPTSSGVVNMTVTVVEAGRKPDILEFANWYWSETKDTWSELLKDAAKKALNAEDS